MVSHLLVDMSWVDFDLGVPPSCPVVQALLPIPVRSDRIGQTVELSKTSQPNTVHEQMEIPVIYLLLTLNFLGSA